MPEINYPFEGKLVPAQRGNHIVNAGDIERDRVNITANVIITSTNVNTYRGKFLYYVNTSGTLTLNLGDDVFQEGDEIFIKHIASTSSGNVEVIPGGSGLIDNGSSIILDMDYSILIKYLGSNNWTILSSYRSVAVPFSSPVISNFSIDIGSRVDLNTDLNVQKTVTYDVVHSASIQSLTLDVETGDNKVLTVPTTDISQSENVILSGITTSTDTTLTFKIIGVDVRGNSFESNAIVIQVRNLPIHEQTHFGYILSTESEADINFTNDDIEARDNFAGDWVVSGIPSDSNLYRIYWAVPTADGSITRVSQGGFTLYEDGLASGNQFTEILNVTIGGQTYNVLLLDAANAVNSNYNGTRLTVS